MPVPGKTFQTCYILATNKTNSKNHKCRNLLSINLGLIAHWASLWGRPQRWHAKGASCHPKNRKRKNLCLTHEAITKCAQNVHREPCHKQRRRRHWLVAATTFEWSSFLHSINGLCLGCSWRRYDVLSTGSYTGFVGNATDTGISRLNFIESHQY